MGTYDSSKIQTARKPFTCDYCHTCIETGREYLRYYSGQRNSSPVCLKCAVSTRRDGHLNYWCAASEALARTEKESVHPIG